MHLKLLHFLFLEFFKFSNNIYNSKLHLMASKISPYRIVLFTSTPDNLPIEIKFPGWIRNRGRVRVNSTPVNHLFVIRVPGLAWFQWQLVDSFCNTAISSTLYSPWFWFFFVVAVVVMKTGDDLGHFFIQFMHRVIDSQTIVNHVKFWQAIL